MKKFLLLFVLTCMSYAAFSNATVAQKEWRWRNDNGSETSATWMSAQDQTPASMSVCMSDTLRLRIAFQVNPDPATTNPASKTTDSHISYSTSPSGPWTVINTSSANAFMQTTSMHVTDGTPTTQQLVHSASGTYASGQFVDQNHPANIVFSTPGGVTTLTEYEWVIVPTSNITAGTYYFQLQGLNSYPNTLPAFNFVGGQTSSTQNVSACGSYTSPSGMYTWTSSGTYNDTIANVFGCDSVITTMLTINNSTASMISATACDSYVSPSGNYTWTSSGTYNDTIANVIGCDSVITTMLTINQSTASTISATACDSYVSSSGNYTWTASGTYNDTISNMAGCDSVITVNLTLLNTMSAQTVTACGSYVSPSGNYTWTTSGMYNDTISNMAGCDSVITFDVTIITVDATTTNVNEMITANNANATYQWVDCINNNTPIPGETGQSFVATANGFYAVLVTENGCTDMSTCTQVTSVGVNEAAANTIAFYPNPNNGSFTIQVASAGVVEICNAVGQVVLTKAISAGSNSISLENAENGVYFVTSVDVNGNRTNQRFVVAK